MDKKIIVGIDIGYHNLGLVKTTISEKGEPTVILAKRIDLTNLKCPNCTVTPHTNDVADLVAHFIHQYHDDVLNPADTILLERQPPGGLTSVEALLLFAYRSKTVLVSPNSMHKHFGIGVLDYENRKLRTEEIAGDYFTPDLKTYWNQVRKHDMADAMCMILYFTHRDREQYRLRNVPRSSDDTFEKFRLT